MDSSTRANLRPPDRPPRLEVTLHLLTPGSPHEAILAARELLLEYGQFVVAQQTVASFCYGALEQEAATLPHSYLDQNGGAILARAGDDPVGFVAWRSLPHPDLANAWELKRLWLRPEARGSGAGRALVQAVIDRARAAGKRSLLLDTEPQSMAAALHLYLQLGFVECGPYNGRSPDGIIYLQKAL